MCVNKWVHASISFPSVLSYSSLLILFYVVLYYGLDERGCGNQVGGEWGVGNIIRTYCMGGNYFQ